MNSCFEKFVGFKRIMSDRLNRRLALKNGSLFLILSKLLKKMNFSLISSSFRNTGKSFSLLMRQKNLLWKR